MMCVCLHVHNACVCVCDVLCALHVCILVLKPLRELNQQLRPCNAVMTSTRYNILNDVFLISAAVDCGNLTNPANGSVNHTAGTTFKQNATYSCDTGYNLVGDSTRVCQATGNWSGSAPTCQGMLLLIFSHPVTS